MANPLLDASDVPDFDAIRPEHVLPAVREVLASNRAAIRERLAAGGPYGWDDAIAGFEALGDHVDAVWGPVSHLHGVQDSEALRAAYNEALPELTDYATELGQDRELYAAYRDALAADDGGDPARSALLTHAVRDFELSGVALEGADRERYREIARELAMLSTRFEEQLLDAARAWQLHCEDRARLDGVPELALGRAAEEARSRGLAGWVFTLDSPAYEAIVVHCADRELRRAMHEAWATRASDAGPCAGLQDNGEVMERILALRQEEAQLLGYRDYAEVSLVPKMATDPDQVEGFLLDLLERSRPYAERELAELIAHAGSMGHRGELQAWDLAYYAERLRESRYQLSDEELRPYFPLPAVLEGMFQVTAAIYGVTVREATPPARAWHPDVRYHELLDGQRVIGGFYLDAYAREGKRGGAWMDDCVARAPGRVPIAHLVLNATPPQGDDPALLSHDEVLTVFHEFGHGLHHLLTEVELPSVGGINGVAWDAVELPSQFMENFAWEREGLSRCSRHLRTGEPLPDELFQRLIRTRRFQAGMAMLRQVEFALFDLRLHRAPRADQPAGSDRVNEVLAEVRALTRLVPAPSYDRFAHGFAHIFGGGYAAGYYSYKWAEVLSSDAFGAFEEDGVLDRRTGERFRRTVLAVGGTVEPDRMFRDFRGRDPSPDALLRHAGLDQEAA